MNRALRICLTGNEPRQKGLFEALSRRATAVAQLEFDAIDPLTKYTAAVLSFTRPRSEWWGSYQMHPLVQRRRRKILQRGLARSASADALVMWGSWFHPTLAYRGQRIRFFNYIDQSRSLTPLPEEPPALLPRLRRSHAMQAMTYRDSSGICCMSRWAHEQTMAAHVLPAGKVHAVGWGPCAIDLSKSSPDFSTSRRIVLHVSNDFRRKGVDHLLATAAKLQETDHDVKFVVIGRDSSGLDISGAPENVQFLGPVYDREVLSDYFRRAAVFFLPHRFDRSPHVLVEAMSAGVPLVVSAQGGPQELTDGTGAGSSVPVGDVDGYASAIRGYLDNPAARQDAGMRGWQLMRHSYTWDAVAERILEIISSTMDSPEGDIVRAGRSRH